jgi:outer membrane lipoprotein-sorting protein
MQISKAFLGLAAAALLVTAGCAQQKAPANKALDAIEASLKDVRDDAAKYAPDGLKGVEAQFARLKESYDKKEYKNVRLSIPSRTLSLRARSTPPPRSQPPRANGPI